MARQGGRGAWRSQCPKREGAANTLGDMHEHSSERFLIAHQGLSSMMESFVAEGLVAYDKETRAVTLTAASRRFIA